MAKRIAIIGGGSSGLTAIKSCIDDDLIPVCFERYSDIGGIWDYSDAYEEGKASVYKSCVINTSKEMMAYSDFPMPVEFPPFIPHHMLLKYLRMYVEHFKLRPYIQFNTTVQRISKAPDYHKTGRWCVKFKNGEEIREEIFEGVMVCTGHHNIPNMPKFKGQDIFAGQSLHSQQYRTPECFRNKRVLVVGIGNSAVDIAVDAAYTASQVYLSTRRGAWVVSRMGVWGLPNDILANSRSVFKMGRQAMQVMVEKMANLRCDHEVYGLKPLHRGLEAHPTINDELPQQIMKGKVKAKSNVSHMTEHTVYFEDNSYEDIDVIVYATGYRYEYTFLDPSVFTIKENKTRLYKYVFPPHHEHPTLGVIGLVQAVGAVMPLSEIQARWFCKIVKEECRLPPREIMLEDIYQKARTIEQQYLHTQRHALETMWVPYMDEIAEQFGVRPNLWRLAQKDPKLAFRCFFGPCVPAQYRLQGSNQWEGAKHCIEQAYHNSKVPLTTRKVPEKPKRLTPPKRSSMNVNVRVEKLSLDTSVLVNLLKVLFFVFLLSCL